MSQRPPATFWITVTATGGAGSSDPNIFTLGASGLSNVPEAIGAQLHLQGIDFGATANGATFKCTRSVQPPGAAATISMSIDAPSFAEIIPAAIDGSTTAFPFTLSYGPLGSWGR